MVEVEVRRQYQGAGDEDDGNQRRYKLMNVMNIVTIIIRMEDQEGGIIMIIRRIVREVVRHVVFMEDMSMRDIIGMRIRHSK